MTTKTQARVTIDISDIDDNVKINAKFAPTKALPEIHVCLYALTIIAERGMRNTSTGTVLNAVFEKVHRLVKNPNGWDN